MLLLKIMSFCRYDALRSIKMLMVMIFKLLTVLFLEYFIPVKHPSVEFYLISIYNEDILF